VVTAAFNPAPDSTVTRELLDGTADARFTIKGALDSMDVEGEVTAEEVHWNGYHMPGAHAEVAWRGGTRPGIELSASVDSVTRRRFDVHGIEFSARGLADSLRWRLSAGSGGSWPSRPAVIPGHDRPALVIDFPSRSEVRVVERGAVPRHAGGQHLVLLRNGRKPEGRVGPDRDGRERALQA
jgi:hypothetical protein